jgi:2-oxoglutarate ferredoxin oxidoreductase subunit beta
MDLCLEAIVSDCGFVARSFAGDPKQLRPLLKAAISYNGTALLDIVSPCVAFNNAAASTKGYEWVRDHDAPLHDITYVPLREEITADYEPGETRTVTLHDGSHIILRKLDKTYNSSDRVIAIQALEHAKEEGTLVTGLIYCNPGRATIVETEMLTEVPLVHLSEAEIRPSKEYLYAIMAGL